MILTFVVVGLAAGIAVIVTSPTVYVAKAQVFATTAGAEGLPMSQVGDEVTSDRVQSYVSIATSPAVTAPVIRQLGLTLTNTTLALKIGASAPLGKVLVNLSVSDSDRQQAARLANAVAAQFDVAVERTEQAQPDGSSTVELSVIHPATVPSAPAAPDKIANLGIGILVGLLIGFGVVIFRNALDNTVSSPEDLAPSGLAVLGVIPFDKRAAKVPVAFRSDPHSARSEAYRQLRTNLQFVDIDQPPRVIAVTSAMPGEGKSLTAINLAFALAESGARICLIGADLRRPSLADALGLVGDVGLTTVLIGKAPIESVIQSVGANLTVLASGPVPPNPSVLIGSEQTRRIIEQAAALADFTVIDAAPLLPVADGAQIAGLADATIVVVRAGKTTRDQTARGIAGLERIGERPVGVVLNMVSRTVDDSEHRYYADHRPNPRELVTADLQAAVTGSADAGALPAGRHAGGLRDRLLRRR